MDTRSAGTRVRRGAAALAAMVGAALPLAVAGGAAAPAAAAPTWTDGVAVRLQGPRCGTFAPEVQLVHSVGFATEGPQDLASGQPRYVRVSLANVGTPCAGFLSPDVQVTLGPSTVLAPTGSFPTRCVTGNGFGSSNPLTGCLLLVPTGTAGTYSLRLANGTKTGQPLVLVNGFSWELSFAVTITMPLGGVERLTSTVAEASQTPAASKASVDMPVVMANPPAPGPVVVNPSYLPLVPVRLLDTRAPAIGYTGGKPAAGATVTLQVTGRSEAPDIDGTASAVMLTVTGTDAAGGYVTVWPCDAPRPTASNLNLPAGGTVANSVIAKLSATGTVCLYTQGSAHLVADAAGWFPDPDTVAAPYHPVTPLRLLETRSAGQTGYTGAKPSAGSVVTLQVAGRGGVPADASAAVLNVTGTEAAGGFVTVWPCDEDRPTASNLNLPAGGTVANLVIARLDGGGRTCLFTQGAAHLVADLAGWFPGDADYTPVTPVRIADTRTSPSGRPRGGSETTLAVAGTVDVPADASAVVLNVTGTNAAGGYVTVYPCGAPRPTASNLNLAPGGTAANLVVTAPGTGGRVCIYTQSAADLVVDLAGWFPAASLPG